MQRKSKRRLKLMPDTYFPRELPAGGCGPPSILTPCFDRRSKRNLVGNMIFNPDGLAWASQVASCFYMTGVILVVQLIHYPSFSRIDKSHFVEFHNRHTQAMGWVAGPAMCVELVSAIWLACSGNGWCLINLLSVILLWCMTFAVSVPFHNRLANGFDKNSWESLTKTNWWRTGLWAIRSFAFLVVLSEVSL